MYRKFVLEVHFGAAFIHWLPKGLYKRLSFLSVRYLFTYNNPSEKRRFEQVLSTTRLLSWHQFVASDGVVVLPKADCCFSRLLLKRLWD